MTSRSEKNNVIAKTQKLIDERKYGAASDQLFEGLFTKGGFSYKKYNMIFKAAWGGMGHTGLLWKHNNNNYIFDPNHDKTTTNPRKWFKAPNAIYPLLDRNNCFNDGREVDKGACFLISYCIRCFLLFNDNLSFNEKLNMLKIMSMKNLLSYLN